MSKEVSGFVAWIRSFLDDVYALKGSGGSITLNDVYPVGSIYMSVNSATPQSLFGGTWVQLQDTFLYATSTTADDNVTTAPNGQGEATHTLIENEMPRHSHKPHQWTIIVSNGGNTGTRTASTGKLWNIFQDDANQNRWTEPTGGGQAHNNMPPYMKVYMWKRTA